MLEYYTNGACFIDATHKETKEARARIEAEIGMENIKQGWTFPRAKRVRAALGNLAINRVRGTFVSIKTHVNKATNGNEYPKIRVELAGAKLIHDVHQDGRWQEGEAGVQLPYSGVILSLDANQEAAHRLVAKLAACKRGQKITIACFAEPVERNGQTFANHIATVKDEVGHEIQSTVDYFSELRKETRKTEARMVEIGITDKRSINDQVKKQKTRFFMKLADSLGKDMPEIVPTKSAEAPTKSAEAKPGATDKPAGSRPPPTRNTPRREAAPAPADVPVSAGADDELPW